jgi:hypothetical protein
MNIAKFKEIEELTFGGKLTIWQGFIKGLHNQKINAAAAFVRDLDFAAAARLARIGLILPTIANTAGRLEELARPLATKMSPPFLPPSTADENESQILKACIAVQSSEPKAKHATRRFQLAT